MRLHFRRASEPGLFGLREPLAFGRTCMVLSTSVSSAVSWLTTGLFYTGFLIAYGIDIVNVGILTLVPYIANCFSIFSPSILERFRKRRWILAAGRTAYYTLNILGITVMPMLVEEPGLRMGLFILLVFSSNIINALFSNGYTVWQLNFIPEQVRARYFFVNAIITNFIGIGIALISSIVTDAISASGSSLGIIVLLRGVAYALALLDVVILSLPREYPYPRSQSHPRLRDILTKPFQHPKFALTMGIVFVWTFTSNIPMSSLDYYLIDTVGVSYTFINVINFFYPVFLLLFMRPWNRLLNKHGWLVTFAVAAALHFPTNILYSCVNASNYLWVIPTVRLTQHLLGVGRNIAYSNFVYLNLPREDQTNYTAFHVLITNIAGFLGMIAGTSFVAAFPDLQLTILGMPFSNVQMLLWALSLGELLVPAAILLLVKRLTPDEVDA